jgi:hypothetical protein
MKLVLCLSLCLSVCLSVSLSEKNKRQMRNTMRCLAFTYFCLARSKAPSRQETMATKPVDPPTAAATDVTMVPFWTPTKDSMEKSEMARFMALVNNKYKKNFTEYAQLWDWSAPHSIKDY